jgi:hypothetical protein
MARNIHNYLCPLPLQDIGYTLPLTLPVAAQRWRLSIELWRFIH